MLLQLTTLAILGRLLAPEDFGLVAAALVVVNFSTIFAQLGVNQALVQHADLPPNAASAAFVITVGLGAVLCLAVYAAAPSIAAGLDLDGAAPLLQLLGFVFLLRAAGSTAEALLLRNLRFRAVALVDLVAYGIGYGAVAVTLAWLEAGPWALVIGHLSHAGLRSILAFALRPHRVIGGVRGTFVRTALRFGSGFSLARIANYIALQADNLIVARTLGAAAVGHYSRAYQLMGMPASLIANALDRVLFPTFARQQADIPMLRDAYLRGTALLAFTCLPLGIGAAIMAPEVVLMVLGDQWDAVVPPFQVFALTMAFRVGDRLNAVVVRAVGAVFRRALLQVAYAAAVIGFAAAGSRYGLVGVAIGVATALTLNYVAGTLLVLHVVSGAARAPLAAAMAAAPATAALAITTALVAWTARSLAFAPWAVVLATLTVTGAATALSVWWSPRRWLGAQAPWLAATVRAFVTSPRPALERWLARLERVG